MKAGTTTLHHWLMQSPRISMKMTETHFFDRDDRYEEGLDAYLESLPKAFDCQLIGDDTPTYSFLEKVPCRIKTLIPSVKILWLIRDPLERAVSHYWHAARKGSETRGLNQAFIEELNGVTVDIWNRYLFRSCYVAQINRYLEFFDKRQIHFVDFTRFAAGEKAEMEAITHFLGIPPVGERVPHSNKAKYFPRSTFNKTLNKMPLPPHVTRGLRVMFSYTKKRKPVLEERIRAEASDFLANENIGLSHLVDFDVS